jgi:hypothetical protein
LFDYRYEENEENIWKNIGLMSPTPVGKEKKNRRSRNAQREMRRERAKEDGSQTREKSEEKG